MATFNPIAVTREGVTIPYKEGQYIVATVEFSDGENSFPAGVYVDMLGGRQQLTVRGEQGIQGEVGPRGEKGERGEQGIQGEIGPQGRRKRLYGTARSTGDSRRAGTFWR